MLAKEPALTPIAGCTDVYVGLALRHHADRRQFIDLWALERAARHHRPKRVLRIGALTTYTEIIASKLVQKARADAGGGGARSGRRADPESRHARRQHRQCLAGRRHVAGAGGRRCAQSCCAAPAGERRGAVRRVLHRLSHQRAPAGRADYRDRDSARSTGGSGGARSARAAPRRSRRS